MKTIVSIAAITMLCSCAASYKEVQVEVVNAELVRIDTISRYNKTEKVLTWKSSDNVRFVSYADIGSNYIVGSRMMVLMRR